MIFSIQDKVTIITGGSSGIGAAAARRFVNAGANVCIASRRDSSAFADEIGAISIMCDVAKESDVRRLIEQVVNRFGRIDVLINNAGRSEEHTSELQSLTRISYAVFCLKKKKSEYKRT